MWMGHATKNTVSMGIWGKGPEGDDKRPADERGAGLVAGQRQWGRHSRERKAWSWEGGTHLPTSKHYLLTPTEALDIPPEIQGLGLRFG